MQSMGPWNPPTPCRFGLSSLTLVVLTAFFATFAVAQSLPVTTYTTDDGLSYSQVWSIHQDRRGYVWIGTTDGLNRWDGVRFTTFSTADGLKDSTIRAIVEDDAGTLWFGTENGVARFDGRRINHFDVPGLEGIVWTGTKDQFGRVWLGTLSHGATVIHNGEFRTYGTAEGLASQYVYGLFADSKGYLWFGHRGDGVTRCRADIERGIDDCRRFGLEDGLPHLDVRAFVEDSRGFVYLGTRGGGIARWDGEEFRTFTESDGIGENDIYALHILSGDEIAVGTLNRGVDFCSLPEFRGCRSFTMSNGLPDDAALALMQDNDQAIWVGYQSGLARISTGNMLSFTVRDGLPHSTAYAVSGDPRGNVWVGTLGGLVSIWIDDETNSATRVDVITSDDALPGDQVWDLLRDSKGRFWVATEGGLCQYDANRKRCARVFDSDNGLPSNDLITLRESSKGEILASTNEGLSIIAIDGPRVSIRNLTTDDGLAGSFVYGIAEDAFGRIWVGSDQGLSVVDGESIRSYTTDDGLPVNEIHAIHRDRDGVLWVGSNGGGLTEFTPPEPGSGEPPRFMNYGTEVGVHPAIAAIKENEDGRLWLGTVRGAILFDPSLGRQGSRAVVALVDRASGLVANEVNAFDYDANGNLWIAAAGGVTRYDPQIALKTVPAPRVIIESVVTPHMLWLAPFCKPDIERSNRQWLDGGRIELAPRSVSVRFDYRSRSLSSPKRVAYQVRLAGFRDEWSDATNVTFKEYTNLFPGRYTFEVRASIRVGVWGEPERIEMEIFPAWWQRRSFIASGLAGFVILLGLGYRARVYSINRRNLELKNAVDERTEDLRRYARALEGHSHALDRANTRIREADRVKSEFLANMSHELRTPLNSIIGFSDVLVPGLESKIGDRQHRFLKNIQTSGRYLLLLINNLLDLSKIEAGRADVVAESARVDEIVETTCEIVQGYAADRKIEVNATVPTSMPKVLIDVPKFRQILLNLLSNAVKFSSAGDLVNVEVRSIPWGSSPLEVDSFELIVSDHGPGISDADREAIFEEFRQVGGGVAHPGGTGLGLALVRRFVELLGGRISVESSTGHGSTFTVLLPVEYRVPRSEESGERKLDSVQPRVIVLSANDEVFERLAGTMEREGFAPVRIRSIEDAVRMVRRIDPVAIVVTINLEAPDDWRVLREVGSDSNLSKLTVGICLTHGTRIAMAIGADSLLLHPFETRAASTMLASFRDAESAAPLFVEDSSARLADLGKTACGNAYASRCATSAANAAALAAQLQPGLVVVDLAADDLTGFDAVSRLQHGKTTRHTPVVIVAPEGLEGSSFSTIPAGDTTTPLDEFALTLHELLRRRSARAVRLTAASLG